MAVGSEPEAGTPAGNYRQRTARSLIWTALESVGLSGVSFATLIVFSRYLSVHDIGVASMALGVVQLMNTAVELLFHDALVQRQEVRQAHFDTAYTVSVGLGVVLSATCWLIARPFANAVGIPELAPTLSWMSLSLPAMGFGAVLIAQQRRDMDFRPLALRSLIGRVAAGVISIAMALMGYGLWSLIAQQVLLVALATAALWIMSSKRPKFGFEREAFRDMFMFGVFSTSFTFIALAIQRSFVILLGSFLGATAVGFFDLAFRVVDMLRTLVSQAVQQLSLTLFAKLRDDRDKFERAYNSAVLYTCALMYPLFAGLAICSPEVTQLVFGDKWLPAAPFVALLSVLTFEFFARMYSRPLMTSVGDPRSPLISTTIQVVGVVVGMLTFGRASLEAAAAVWAGRLVFSLPVDVYLLRKVTGIGIVAQFRGLPTLAAVSGVMVLVVWGAKLALLHALPTLPRLIAMVAIGVLAYVVSLLIVNRRLLLGLLEFARAARAGNKGAAT